MDDGVGFEEVGVDLEAELWVGVNREGVLCRAVGRDVLQLGGRGELLGGCWVGG